MCYARSHATACSIAVLKDPTLGDETAAMGWPPNESLISAPRVMPVSASSALREAFISELVEFCLDVKVALVKLVEGSIGESTLMLMLVTSYGPSLTSFNFPFFLI